MGLLRWLLTLPRRRPSGGGVEPSSGGLVSILVAFMDFFSLSCEIGLLHAERGV